MGDRPPLMTREELAEFLGVPPKTLAQWAYKGLGPAYVRVGRHARYRPSDVDEWLRQQQMGVQPA